MIKEIGERIISGYNERGAKRHLLFFLYSNVSILSGSCPGYPIHLLHELAKFILHATAG